jgi:NTP pyrophosphatase (non-canonical NTP hydrolase)
MGISNDFDDETPTLKIPHEELRDLRRRAQYRYSSPHTMLTLTEYVAHVLRTESRDPTLSGQDAERRLLHSAIGLATEAGETLDVMKKRLFYDMPLDKINLIEELGDIAWYWALACDALEISPQEVLERNVAKLRLRYPDRFDPERAAHRDLSAEMSALANDVNPIDTD